MTQQSPVELRLNTGITQIMAPSLHASQHVVSLAELGSFESQTAPMKRFYWD